MKLLDSILSSLLKVTRISEDPGSWVVKRTTRANAFRRQQPILMLETGDINRKVFGREQRESS